MSPERRIPNKEPDSARFVVVPRDILPLYQSLIEVFNQAKFGDITFTESQRKTYPGTRQSIGTSNVVVELEGTGNLVLFVEIMAKTSSVVETMTKAGKGLRPQSVLKTLLQEDVASSRHKQQMIQQALAVLEKSSNPVSRLLNQEPPSAHNIALATQTLKEFIEIRPGSIASVGEIRELLGLILPCVDVVVLDLATDDLRKIKGITEANVKSDKEKGELSLKIQYILDKKPIADAPRNELNIQSDKTGIVIFGTAAYVKLLQKMERENRNFARNYPRLPTLPTPPAEPNPTQSKPIDTLLLFLPYDVHVIAPRINRDEVSREDRRKAKLQAAEFVYGEGFHHYNAEKNGSPKKIKGYVRVFQDALGRVLQVAELRDKFYTRR